MAVILYRCDVCKRDIELARNIAGIETPQRCIITHGCRGKLYQQKILPDFVRGSIPVDVIGLDNYQQRKVLFNHTQPIESTDWIIQHNLGTFPSVSVFANRPTVQDPNARLEITPTSTVTVNPDTTRLVFSRPESGIAQFVARASDPQLLQPFVRDTVNSSTTTQITGSSELTIATRTSAPNAEPSQINIELVYTTPTGTIIPVSYTADDQPSITSPWSGFDRVVIGGRVFTVRSFSIVIDAQLSGIIPSGSTVQVSSVDDGTGARAIERNELLVLLAAAPYKQVDRIDNKIVDLKSVASQTSITPFAMFFSNGEFTVSDSIIKTLHPTVRSI